MKITTLTAMFSFIVMTSMTSCSSTSSNVNITPEEQAKIAAIANLALTYAESKGKVTTEDAAAVRQAGTIILTPTPASTVSSVTVGTPVETKSGK